MLVFQTLHCTSRQKLPPDFIQMRNKLMIYKLREEKIRKTSQQMAETSILTNIQDGPKLGTK